MSSSRRCAVVAFTGHMTDAPDRSSPRFPESQVVAVRGWIAEVLRARGDGLVGVSSAARGADLLFLEELLALGGRATVLLPFPRDDFERTSVGEGWNERFRAILRNDRVEVPPPIHACPPESDDARAAAYEECNAAIVSAAHDIAKSCQDAEPLLLAVFRESKAHESGGTHDAIRRWKERHGRVEVIDPIRGPVHG